MHRFFRLTEFTLSVRTPVGGSRVSETSVCLYAESTTYVKFLESEAKGFSVRMTGKARSVACPESFSAAFQHVEVMMQLLTAPALA
jgi:hypothetical protein